MDNELRLHRLRELIQEDPSDPFLRYGLCLEYQKMNHPETLPAWDQLLHDFPDYLPAYYQAGMAHHPENQEKAEAVWQTGIELALKLGDHHALAELRSILLNSQLGELD